MGFALLMLVVVLLMFEFWRQQLKLEQRNASQRDLPREALIPRHYRCFTEVEQRLWEAVGDYKPSGSWEEARFAHGEPGFEIVREYVRGVREDFRRGHRIFGQVILHAPEMELFAQLEWARIKIEFSYYRRCALVWFRLKTGGVSVKELRQLTDIVATLAYRVRTMLATIEAAGQVEFVDSILRRS